jgi:eukaryotic-like serine/threonine-protein kinase
LVAPDSVVQYLVSDGPGTGSIIVPNISGTSRSAARKALKAAGLKSRTSRCSHPAVAEGLIVSQMPPAGARVATGATVGLVISRGSSQRIEAPDIAGKSAQEASKAVTAAGFSPMFVDVVTSSYQPGTVFGQYPVSPAQWPLKFPLIAVVATSP